MLREEEEEEEREREREREREMEDMGSYISISSKSYPMTGGDGPYSYTKNSRFQREAITSAKSIIDHAVAEKLDTEHLSSTSNPFCITDLGCSAGPNTFIAVQNIIEAVELKYRSIGLGSNIPEFQIFFNDHESNDFNTLFTSLPPNRQYFVAGVPGSFHGRLFPKAYLHFVYSSYAVHWLSKVPKEVVDKNSHAWNKGSINHLGASNEVVEAYLAQFAKDMDKYLHSRAEELVSGGLMTIILPSFPNECHGSQYSLATLFAILTSSLMDLSKMGLFSEAKVDSFNVPAYFARPRELEEMVVRNGYFSIERMELLAPDSDAQHNLQLSTMHMRAFLEGIIREHFGSEILDELFDRFSEKLTEPSNMLALSNQEENHLAVVLKRK